MLLVSDVWMLQTKVGSEQISTDKKAKEGTEESSS